MAPFLFDMIKQFSIALIIALAVVAVYFPGLDGPFVFDDYYNFVDNPGVKIDGLSIAEFQEAIAASTSGPLKRPIPVLSLSLNYYFFGLDTFSFKLVNLLIHLLNGLLVYVVFLWLVRAAKRVVGDDSDITSWHRALLMTVTAAWLLHPMNVTSVLYVVQRMNSMATFFMLAAMIFYLRARLAAREPAAWGWLVAAIVSAVTAIFCKENAAVLFFVLLAIEVALLGFAPLSGRRQHLETLLKWGYVLGSVSVMVVVVWYFDSLVAGYESRPYSMLERVLTQGRALVFYIGQIVLPNSSKMALFHDEIAASRSLIDPVTTLLSFGFLAALTLITIWYRGKNRLFLAGWLWFLAGHLIESGIVPLELVHEHRNYFPMLGLLMMAYSLLSQLMNRVDGRKVLVLFVGYVLLLGSVTFSRANDWSGWAKLVLSEAAKNPESARSNFEAARYYFGLLQINAAKNPDLAYESARRHFAAVINVDPNSWYGFSGLIRLNDLVGKPTDERVWQAFQERLREKNVQHMDVNQFLGVLDCQMSAECTLEREPLFRSIDAALANPYLTNKRKRFIANAATALSLKYRQVEQAQEYSLKVLDYNETIVQSYKNALEIATLRSDGNLISELVERMRQNLPTEEIPGWIEQYE